VKAACPRCGELAPVEDRFCEACGERLAPVAEGSGDGCQYEIDAGDAAGLTHRGLVKPENQDALYLGYADGRLVAVICDGVSTSVAAADAARIACAAAGSTLASTDRDLGLQAAMEQAVAEAQRAVAAIPWRSRSGLAAPACTIVAAFADDRGVTVGSLGDSRAYWVSAGEAVALTADDSWARHQVDAGVMTREEAEADNRAHQITRWLGADAPDATPSVTTFVAAEQGQLLVCSDGLWNYAPTPEAIADWAGEHPEGTPPITVARALVEKALVSGGHDNITVAVAGIFPAEKGRAG
jgi:serine/threonine protein phosphatase PrpC